MHDWNRDSFEDLAAIAVALDAVPGCEDLARYCRDREEGRRSRAFRALARFLAAVRQRDTETQRAICISILGIHERHRGARQFLSHPLLETWILPLLDTWLEEESGALPPTRALGILRCDDGLLRRALLQDPEDARVRSLLIGFALDEVDYACHHLHEGKFLGEPEEAAAALAEARALVAAAPDPARFAAAAAEIDRLAQLLEDWRAFCQSPGESFPAWCAARGREHRWRTTVYYDR